jgi:DNA-binding NarL/FixJ family response regulator
MSEKKGRGRLMASARIIIADHSELVGRGIAELLAARGYEVLGIAATSEEVVALAASHPDGLVLVDESIDGEGAASLIRSLLAKNPRQPTIVLNGSWDLSEVVLGLAAGAVGVIDKSCAPEHLFAAIDIVVGGGMVFSSEAVETLRDQLTEVFDLVVQRTARRLALTQREMEVLELLPTSMTLSQMAVHLFVSRKTIQNNASSLYRKLGATGRTAAVLRAMELGLLAPRSERVTSM